MSPTRSEQLFAVWCSNGAFTTVYTVAAGDVIILKSLLLSTRSGSATNVTVYVQPAGLANSLVLAHFDGMEADTSSYSEYWMVLKEGDTIVVYGLFTSYFFALGSGAVLPAPS